MRAKEFIKESEMHHWHHQGIPGMKSLNNIGQYYEIYRFGIAMAQVGNDKDKLLGDAHGVTEDEPTTLSYTQADEDIINAALKRTGHGAKQITSRKSEEPSDTNKQSPVQARGPVKRRS